MNLWRALDLALAAVQSADAVYQGARRLGRKVASLIRRSRPEEPPGQPLPYVDVARQQAQIRSAARPYPDPPQGREPK